MEHAAWFIVLAGLLIFLAHLFAGLFERTRVPDVLPLVLIGLALGPLAGLLSAEGLGRIGNVFTTLALVVILFEGGLDLNVVMLVRSMSGAARLAVVNVVATTIGVGLGAHAWLSMPPLPAVALGTIAGATSSAVVIPMVARLRLSSATRTTLVLESALSDVLCIILVLGYAQASKVGHSPGLDIVGRMISSLLLAVLIGLVAGVAWALMLERVRRLQTSMFTTPAFVFVVFGITELLGFSGAIAALTFGFVLGNTESLQTMLHRLGLDVQTGHLLETERAFFAELVFVVKTFFFVYIGISMRVADLELLGAGLAAVGATMLLRVLVVRVSLGRRTPTRDAAIATVMIPKGLAAAVLASLVVEVGMPQGDVVRDVSYAMILFSIAATAVMAFLVENDRMMAPFRRLYRDPGQVRAPDPSVSRTDDGQAGEDLDLPSGEGK